MNFLPQMSSRIDGFSIQRNFHRHYWDGMVVDLWDVDCASEAGGTYASDHPRLFAVLETRHATAARFSMVEHGRRPITACEERAVSFIPAGLELRTELSGVSFLRHLDLHFDIDSLTRRFGDALPQGRLDAPRFTLKEERLLLLADLIARECASPDPLHQLYGEGLTLALLTDMLKIAPTHARERSRLASWQLRKVTDFIADNCHRAIRLDELSDMTGLSQSHFSHAFKASTGTAPHQFQLRARIERVKVLLARKDLSLTAVAAETGFADPAHFSRSFRKVTGLSPSAWRRERLR